MDLWIFTGLLVLSWSGSQSTGAGQAGDGRTYRVRVSNPPRFLWGKLPALAGSAAGGGYIGEPVLCHPAGKAGFQLDLCWVHRRVRDPSAHPVLAREDARRAGETAICFRRKQSPTASCRLQKDWKRVLAALGIAVGMLILTAAYARTGWFYVFPINVRLMWLVIFTPFTALGFWIGLHEGQMVQADRFPVWGADGADAHRPVPVLPVHAPDGGHWVAFGDDRRFAGTAHPVAGAGFRQPAPGSGAPSVADGSLHGGLLYWLILPQGVLF